MSTSNSQSSMPSGTSSTPGPTFSPGASPPLILAFLAIGLFAVSMIGVFGWRRVQYSRLVAAGNNPTWLQINTFDTSRRDIGPEPKLYEVWTTIVNPSGTKDQPHEREAEWEAIMPIAVITIPTPDNVTTDDDTTNNDTTADAGEGGSSRAFRTWPRIAFNPMRYLQRTRRRRRSTTPTSADTTGSAAASGKATIQQDSTLHDVGRLQVAVAIAMPSQGMMPSHINADKDEHRREGNRPGPETDHTLEYALGVYQFHHGVDGGGMSDDECTRNSTSVSAAHVRLPVYL
ncbi:hypothetical protein LshimejAT787_1101810 [Lyophyllum shimeji]|uniref:Uncharacterized protein n=1 Tax=Lyophyllum shimeji TaxID=47721 RepID=A0A9P3PVV7_LYOSH|nr:hypothetical protein LshimejAT787_1101810 [Lyophyllum shimeji]